jgi:hypothetical protein
MYKFANVFKTKRLDFLEKTILKISLRNAQQKIEALRLHKKGLMQGLFPGVGKRIKIG